MENFNHFQVVLVAGRCLLENLGSCCCCHLLLLLLSPVTDSISDMINTTHHQYLGNFPSCFTGSVQPDTSTG